MSSNSKKINKIIVEKYQLILYLIMTLKLWFIKINKILIIIKIMKINL